VHTCNPSTFEAEAEESQIPSQSGPHKETLSQKKKKKVLHVSLVFPFGPEIEITFWFLKYRKVKIT
jgi:hypothetical protein